MTSIKSRLYRAKTDIEFVHDWRNNRSQVVKNAELRLTWRCNARCVMCDIWRYSYDDDDSLKLKTGLLPLFQHELTTEQACGVIDQLADLGLELMTISGGEPTMRSDLPEIVSRASGRGVRVQLNTNGASISPELANALIEGGLKQANVSVDGPTEAIHDRIRGRGMFASTVAGMGALKQAAVEQGRSFHLHVHCVITGSNYKTLEQFLDVQEAWDWDSLSFGPMLHGEEDEWQQLNKADQVMPLTAEAIRYLVQDLAPRLAARAQRSGLSVAPLPFGASPADWEANARGIYCEPEQFCTVPWYHTTIQPNGDVIPCCYSPNTLTLGNVVEKPFAEIYNGESYQRFRTSCKPVRYSMCRSCIRYRPYNARHAERLQTLKGLGLAGPAS